ncbi:MAG: hypothetical protein ICV83_17625 [Cytophagales bacterium]|nr:hypothetical protein [Cytophagales bacterium]
MKRRCTLFPALAVLLLVTTRPLPAQEGIALRGQALDARTGQPVFYAKIGVLGSDLNAFTDLDGVFTLEDLAVRQSDTLIFSSLRYEATKVPVAALWQAGGVVTLGPRRHPSNAGVPVKSIDPAALVRLAADAATRQYDRTPGSLELSFREQIQAVQGEQESFSAAAQGFFTWRKSAYGSREDDEGNVGLQTGGKRDVLYGSLLRSYHWFLVTPFSYPLQNGGRITNFPLNNPRYHRLYNGYNPCFYHPADLEELDAIRYPESFLNPERIGQYRFYLLDYVTLHGENVMVIGFGPKNMWVTRAYFTGRIFIATDEKAIIRADFQLSPGELVLFNYNSTIETIQRSYVVHYARQGDGWVFDGGSIKTAFRRRPQPSRFLSTIHFKAVPNRAAAARADNDELTDSQPFVSQLPDDGNRP